MANHLSSRWIYPVAAGRDASLRLFLLHHAGGAASMYRDWASLVPADVAVQCIQLPGRQERGAEQAFTAMAPLVATLGQELASELDDRPYALFGHSMGAQLAYRLAAEVARDGGVGPVLVGASAWSPVGFCPIPPDQPHWPQDRLVAWVRRLGSLPPQVCEDREMLSLVMPALRADLAVVAGYCDDGARVACPVVSYSARSDPLVPVTAMAAWATRTPVHLGNRVFPGGHFFVQDHPLAILTDFDHLLRRWATPAPPC